MANFDPKNELVRGRAAKVQTLRIPFTITGSATSGNVASSSDEPAVFFVRTEGLDQITTPLAGETASYGTRTDSSGNFSVLVVIGETVTKVMCARVVRRTANGQSVCSLANTTGITTGTGGGTKICLNALTSVDLTAGNLDATLEVSYTV